MVSAHLRQFLHGMKFPAHRDDMVRQAKENGADQGVIETLHVLRDRTYESISDVMNEAAHVHVT